MSNPTTKQECFDFERDQRPFFDNYYTAKGWHFRRTSGKENIKYDVMLFIEGREVKVQEKARSREFGDLLVELVQDINTNSPGWLYTCGADFILYKTPNSFYWINRPKLRAYMGEHGTGYATRESGKGWGRTLNAVVPWAHLTARKIAGKIVEEIA